MFGDEDKVISSLQTMIAILRHYLVPFKMITFLFSTKTYSSKPQTCIYKQ